MIPIMSKTSALEETPIKDRDVFRECFGLDYECTLEEIEEILIRRAFTGMEQSDEDFITRLLLNKETGEKFLAYFREFGDESWHPAVYLNSFYTIFCGFNCQSILMRTPLVYGLPDTWNIEAHRFG
jgi:hypothetical protein